jgi:ElaB/YqjD/DUF883 family membrane-anchored ribosome-binding protein
MARNADHPNYQDGSYARTDVYTEAGTVWYKKLSWGAILAGVLISLVSMLVLNLLGIGIGLASINPVAEQNAMSGIGTGAIIWWIISNLISIFAGAFIAARVAGIPLGSISIIHGVLSWCAFTLILFWLLTTTVGSIISGVGSVISQTLSTVGSGVEAIIDNPGNNQNQNMNQNQNLQSSISVGQITTEIKQILRQTEDPQLQPDSVRQTAQQSIQNIRQSLRNEENLTDQEIQSMVQELLNRTQNLTQEINREDVVNVVAARTDLSEQTVNNIADVVVRNVQQAQQRLQELKAEARQEAQQAAQKAADAASSAAIWSFVALLLGAGVAVAGGKVGTPKRHAMHEEREVVNY